MIFTSLDYFIFFLTIIFLMIILKGKDIKKLVLLIGSYYFYAYWDWRFVFLMFIMSLVNYLIGLKIEESSDKSTKKKWLITSVAFNLIILGFFKYYNFFIDSLNVILDKVNIHLSFLNILLPIAISFITFEVISYVIDIYRNENKSAKTFWDLALLVAFFPHLIAGPILKPKQFLPQLDKEIIIKWKNIEYGAQIFLLGATKKLLIADQIAPYVDNIFKSPELYDSVTVWFAVIAYAIQIFCDFSGYSDMAIGSAKCLGFEIPANFSMPYISRSITEFWRRWHISLSTWLKEYLYYSLGGNRKGKTKQYINLALVMLLGGLWHGASWNFVIWGGLHGLGLMAHKFYMHKTKNLKHLKNNIIYNSLCWLVTFNFVCFAWVFFRAESFEKASFIVSKMCGLIDISGINWIATSLLFIIPTVIISHIAGNILKRYPKVSLGSFSGLFIVFFILLGILFLQPTNSSPFIYFQF